MTPPGQNDCFEFTVYRSLPMIYILFQRFTASSFDDKFFGSGIAASNPLSRICVIFM